MSGSSVECPKCKHRFCPDCGKETPVQDDGEIDGCCCGPQWDD